MSWRVPLTAAVAAAALVAPDLVRHKPWLVWNATASAPMGFYRLADDTHPVVGELIFIRAPAPLAAWLDTHGYAPLGAPLLKRVAALAPSVVCRAGPSVTIDGRPAGLALPRGRRGEALPVWSGCRKLKSDQLFLLNAAPFSLDGRYFGPLPLSAVLGRAAPLWLGATK